MQFWQVINKIATFIVIFSVIQVVVSRYMISKNIALALMKRLIAIAEWTFGIALAVICICSLQYDTPSLYKIFLGVALGNYAYYLRKKYIPK